MEVSLVEVTCGGRLTEHGTLCGNGNLLLHLTKDDTDTTTTPMPAGSCNRLYTLPTARPFDDYTNVNLISRHSTSHSNRNGDPTSSQLSGVSLGSGGIARVFPLSL